MTDRDLTDAVARRMGDRRAVAEGRRRRGARDAAGRLRPRMDSRALSFPGARDPRWAGPSAARAAARRHRLAAAHRLRPARPRRPLARKLVRHDLDVPLDRRSEEHTSELQSLMRISYAVFCLKQKNRNDYQTAESDHLQHFT